jgi:hypothetical protein
MLDLKIIIKMLKIKKKSLLSILCYCLHGNSLLGCMVSSGAQLLATICVDIGRAADACTLTLGVLVFAVLL